MASLDDRVLIITGGSGGIPGNADAVKAGFEGQVPLGRYGKNEEIVAMITWLYSAFSTYCTGQRFVADGGFLSQ